MTIPPIGSEGERDAGCFTIAADHPALPGHFPGNPVVPGVLLLDRAIALIRADLAAADPRSPPPPALTMAKFLAVVRPGEPVRVAHARQGGGIGVICRVGAVTVLRGRLG